MRLIYLVLLILTNAITAFSTTVIVEPYRDLDYENLNVYRFDEDEDEELQEEPCPENPIEFWRKYGN